MEGKTHKERMDQAKADAPKIAKMTRAQQEAFITMRAFAYAREDARSHDEIVADFDSPKQLHSMLKQHINESRYATDPMQHGKTTFYLANRISKLKEKEEKEEEKKEGVN